MQNQNTVNEKRSPSRRGRGCMIWLGGILGAVLILVLIGAIYEPAAEAADAKAYPPPGKMVDIGGYRLHLNCTGTGSPTVVVESGWGDFSSTWAWVQPEVAKTTRICTYDRAGMGWSEASPEPRTAREFAKELHTLLAKAGETGPYVLVGHSLGGYTVRVYAHDYPEEVAGVVFVDAQDLSKMASASAKPAPKPGKTSLPWLMARIGLIRRFPGIFGSVEELPEGVKQAYMASSVAPRSAQTFIDEGKGMSEGAAQAREVTSLGALPIIVLSAGDEMNDAHAASQTDYAQLSTNSQQIVVEHSAHHIMIDKPEAVTAAILNIVEQARK